MVRLVREFVCRIKGATRLFSFWAIALLSVALFPSLLSGQAQNNAPRQALSDKYGSLRDVLRGSSELFRMNTTFAPLPPYPEPLQRSGRQGLVVIGLAVEPDGRVQDHLIHESFDPLAASSVIDTIKTRRFHSIEAMRRNGVIEDCEKCIRIGRLAFRFEIRNGKGVAVDLADEENRRMRHPNVFEKKHP
ncbi:MAG: hypothetical protein KatS3mg005_1096 [Bryobacteraceae bacterium]|nr:MAG: hypothetical protein KatS3mg005_1096 [Bryobacteraceae bacterium]